MKTAAAKGRSLFSLAALCLALVAVPAQAVRLLPSSPSLDAAPRIAELVDLQQPSSPHVAGLPLFTLEDHWLVTVLSVVDAPDPGELLPHDRYRLFAESQSLPPPVRAALIAKLASGLQTWPDAPISLGRIDLEEKSHRLFFQGLWTDPTTGLAYARNRWYDPHNAAWLSEDPIGPVDSPNLYAFVGWGPNSGTDPMGTGGPIGATPGQVLEMARIEGVSEEGQAELLLSYQMAGEFTLGVMQGAGNMALSLFKQASDGPLVASVDMSIHAAMRVQQAHSLGGTTREGLVVAGCDLIGATPFVEGLTGWEVYGDRLSLQESLRRTGRGTFSLGLTVSGIAGGVRLGTGAFRLARESMSMDFLTNATREGVADFSADMGTSGGAPGRGINPALAERLEAYKAWKGRAGIEGTPTTAQFRRFMGAHRPGSRGMTLYGPRSNFAAWSRGSGPGRIHGNSLLSPRPAYLYRLWSNEGDFLKWGISQNPQSRYPSGFMMDKIIDPMQVGPRPLILQLERHVVETKPGPLNLEPWAGANR